MQIALISIFKFAVLNLHNATITCFVGGSSGAAPGAATES